MLNQESKKSNVRVRAGITLMVGLLGLAIGLWIGSTVLDIAGDKVSELQAEIQGLQTDLEHMDSASQILTQEEANLRIQLSQAEERASSALNSLAEKESDLELLTSAHEQIANLEEQLQSLQSRGQGELEAVRRMSDTLESHRLLLVELRKDPPETREETVTYWNNIKILASRANPELTSPTYKVILKIDNYFDWTARSPNPSAPDAEYADAYLNWLEDYSTSGAIAYDDAIIAFNRYALLAVITQLDSMVSQLN